MRYQDYLRDVPDFPKPGIVFKDITPLLAAPEAFAAACDELAAAARGLAPTRIGAIESRGFLFGAPLAERLALPLFPLRKPGKLPAATLAESYDLEYGSATLEVHTDAAGPGDRVLLVDDLLATGGTVAAAASLVRRLGAEVAGAAFLIELAFLGGRRRLDGLPVLRLVEISGE
ncbi:MAG: adenine phosphoribosyltransferase [Planctomycetota bacterium]|nr:MAG: adenine phosphoribosyltransferase [Planctomycetota bacterium]